jgi:syntaxin 5
MTTSENRTLEFFNVAKSLPLHSRNVNGSAPPLAAAAAAASSSSSTKNNSEELRTFHQQASEISRDIHVTSTLLKELTHAIRHQSLLFSNTDAAGQDASSSQHRSNQLVVRIKNAMQNLHVRLESAQSTLLQQQQQQRRRQLGHHNHTNSQMQQEATNIVVGLQSEFAETAADFKKVLQQRTEAMKETDYLQQQLYHSSTNGASSMEDMDDIPDMSVSHHHQQQRHRTSMTEPPPVFATGGHFDTTTGTGAHAHAFPTLDLTSSLLLPNNGGMSLPRPHGITGSATNYTTTSTGTGTSTTIPTGSNSYLQQQQNHSNYSGHHSISLLTPLDIQRMEQEMGDEQMMLQQLIPDHSYLQTRADAMSTVETNIVELGTIFQKLAGLVQEHKEMVQRVEDNVEEANVTILQSMHVLTDTLTNLRSNKALMMRLFAILVVFIITFIVFFA